MKFCDFTDYLNLSVLEGIFARNTIESLKETHETSSSKGKGNDRYDPLKFTIYSDGIKLGDFLPNADGYTFAAHIANFTYDGVSYSKDNSAFFADGAAPVTEPATMLLLGTGLVGLAGFGRKKFKK